MRLRRAREWWLARARSEGDATIGAGGHRAHDWRAWQATQISTRPEFLRDMAAWRRRKARAEALRRAREASVLGLVGLVSGLIGGTAALGGAWLLGWLR